MKIILKQDVANLGYKDDVVEVKNGYGRNYLIPTGKAIMATPSALKVLAENQRQQAHKIAKIKADAEALAATFEGVAVTIATKVSANGTIYGSVNNIMIAEALAEQGHQVDRRKLILKENIKELGDFVAVLDLHKEVKVEIPVKVVAENAAVEAPAEETVEAPAAPEVVEAPAEEAPAEEAAE